MEYRDGNALAGTVAEIMGIDLTSAVLTCAGCGASGRFAEGRVYDRAPGTVMRCPHCDEALVRIVRTPTDVWLDLRGFRSIRIAV